MVGENRFQPFNVEIFGRQTNVIDVRSAPASAVQSEKLRPISDSKVHRRGSLTADHRHSEQTLIEINGTLQVGNLERHMIDPPHAYRRPVRLRKQAWRHRQSGQRKQHLPS